MCVYVCVCVFRYSFQFSCACCWVSIVCPEFSPSQSPVCWPCSQLVLHTIQVGMCGLYYTAYANLLNLTSK